MFDLGARMDLAQIATAAVMIAAVVVLLFARSNQIVGKKTRR